MQNLFVYGTLLSSEITEKLTGKTFETTPAVLEGYKMYCVKDCDYPAIVGEVGAETKGKILINVDDSALKILSVFEGDEYEEKKITVLINGKPQVALAFVWVKGIEYLENKKWDFQEFKKYSLENFLNVVIPETLEEFYRK